MFKTATPPLDAPITAWREGFEKLCGSFEIPENTVIEAVQANGIASLTVRAPGAAEDRAVLHFHSGGYVMGSPTGYRNFAARISAVSGATILLPDYRLAPEHPYPAAVEDAAAAYGWALDRWGMQNLALSGDSAGGGLCIATLLKARDTDIALPCCAAAISPLLDLAAEGHSASENHGFDPLIDRDLVVGMGRVYLAGCDPHETPLASPLWGRHHGLPPLYLTASASEVLRDDATRLAESVRAAGGRAELVLADGMVHVWTLFPFLPQAEKSLAEYGAFLRTHLGIA